MQAKRSSDDDDDDGQTSRQIDPRKRPAKSVDRPIYGNFQRYYHIRNPANSTSDDTLTSSTHPALALDSRTSAILSYLRDCYAHHETALANEAYPSQYMRLLDVGCNSGKVTIEIAQTLPGILRECGQPPLQASDSSRSKSAHLPEQVDILGVDIDPLLVRQARTAAAVARSRYRPDYTPAATATPEGNVHGSGSYDSLPHDCAYFPSVFPSLYGNIPSLADEGVRPRRVKRHLEEINCGSSVVTPEQDDAVAHRGTDQHDQSDHFVSSTLRFVALDWVNPQIERRKFCAPFSYEPSDLRTLKCMEKAGLDIVLALSITKWIHIQRGDLGLVLLFARIANTLKRGGLLFLERQEWPSYHSAKNLDPTMRSKIKSLKLRPGGDFDWWLDTLGLTFQAEIGQGVGFGFSRPLQVFRKESLLQEKARLVSRLLEESVLQKLEPIAWVARSASSA